jgi:hypothetical protein
MRHLTIVDAIIILFLFGWLYLPGSLFAYGSYFVRNIIAACLSAMICFSYIRFSDLRSNGFKLVFFLALCDFLLNIKFMVFTLIDPNSIGFAACKSQAVLVTFLINAGMFWTLLISVTMYSVIGDIYHTKPFLRRFVSSPFAYHAAVWGYSSFCSLLPLFIEGGYGQSGGNSDCGFVFDEKFSRMISVALLFVNIWGTMLATAVIVCTLRGQLKNILAIDYDTRKSLRENSGQVSPETKLLLDVHNQLKWYPIGLLVGWSLDSSFRFYQIVTGTSYIDMPGWAIYVFGNASGCSLQAVLNAGIYGFTPSVRRRWSGLIDEMVNSKSLWPLLQLEGSVVDTLRESVSAPAADEGLRRQSLRESISTSYMSSSAVEFGPSFGTNPKPHWPPPSSGSNV